MNFCHAHLMTKVCVYVSMCVLQECVHHMRTAPVYYDANIVTLLQKLLLKYMYK